MRRSVIRVVVVIFMSHGIRRAPAPPATRESVRQDARRGRGRRRTRAYRRRCLIGKRQHGVVFCTAERAVRALPQEEQDERGHEAETDREGEWDDGHGSEGER
jgi:hypothetical protein